MRRILVSLIAVVFSFGLTLGVAGQVSAAPKPKIKYVALGDSIAAGIGLGNADTTCGRTKAAYPYQVAKKLKATLTHLACSGAKADEGLYGKQKANGTKLTPQLTAAFANGKPDVITITIGANDARWHQFVRDCQTWRCGSDWDDARSQVYLADLSYELHKTLWTINKLSNGKPPKVVMNGYYSPVSIAYDCTDLSKITNTERNWLNSQRDALNQTIQDATSWYSFASYADIDFTGHEICSSKPWVQGLNDPAPIHPTTAGQTAIAKANLKALGY